MFVLKAAVLLEKNVSESRETAVDAFHSLARYVDAQYQSIVDHVNSSAFEAKQEHIRMARNDTEQLKKIGQTARYEDYFPDVRTFVQHILYVFCYICSRVTFNVLITEIPFEIGRYADVKHCLYIHCKCQ